ncbi:MAG: zf-HC2 domain-containing protein [Proteobacteria bacterium]|nr:zf-HC2 domain-containing protein [Pseudomonadota bacterium]
MSVNCGDIETLVQTFLDGELAADDEASLEEHVAACGACKKHVTEETQFHRHVREKLAPPAAPAALYESISAALDREDWTARKRDKSHWSWILPGGASLAAAAALILFVVSVQGDHPRPETTVDAAVKRHMRRLPIEVRGAAVGDWADRHLRQRVHLPRFNNPETTLRGARLSHLNGRDALQIYYDVSIAYRNFEISALLLDASDIDLRTGRRHVVAGRELWVGQSMGYNVVAHKDKRGIGYVFTSEMNVEDLLRIVANTDVLLSIPEGR